MVGRVVDSRVHFQADDILLMLDASWHLPAWPAIREAQRQGCPVGCVYFDLIPLKHPEFCVDGLLVPYYRDWLDNDPDWDSLRDDPRFIAFLEKVS